MADSVLRILPQLKVTQLLIVKELGELICGLVESNRKI